MKLVDNTKPRTVAVIGDNIKDTVMPVLTILDESLKAHGLEFVLTTDVLANGSVVQFVDIVKKSIKRTRRSRRSSLLG